MHYSKDHVANGSTCFKTSTTLNTIEEPLKRIETKGEARGYTLKRKRKKKR